VPVDHISLRYVAAAGQKHYHTQGQRRARD
jgi:hypothetical protein